MIEILAGSLWSSWPLPSQQLLGQDTRSPQYRDGQRNAIKWAITWLHRRAESMNDVKMVAILNSAAFELGIDWKYYQVDRVEDVSNG